MNFRSKFPALRERTEILGNGGSEGILGSRKFPGGYEISCLLSLGVIIFLDMEWVMNFSWIWRGSQKLFASENPLRPPYPSICVCSLNDKIFYQFSLLEILNRSRFPTRNYCVIACILRKYSIMDFTYTCIAYHVDFNHANTNLTNFNRYLILFNVVLI